jgi:ribose transport system substrate-binding protein
VKFVVPGPAFKLASDIRGKTIYIVPNTTTGTFWPPIIDGLKDAAAPFGVKVVAYDSQYTTAGGAKGIEQAIARKADAIIIGSLQSKALAAPIKAATKAGIPVVMMFDQEKGPVSAPQKALGIFGNVGTCDTCAGRVLAALAVVQSNGKANAVSITSPEIPPAKFQSEGFVKGIKEFCPTCKVKEVNVPLSAWSTQLASATTAAIADRGVNFIVPVFSDMNTFMLPAVHAGNAQDRVTMLSQGVGSAAMIELIKKDDVVRGIVGSPDPWYGWSAFDQVLRALSDRPPATNSFLPTRLFTQDNVGSLNLKAAPEKWFGLDWRPAFKKLWSQS